MANTGADEEQWKVLEVPQGTFVVSSHGRVAKLIGYSSGNGYRYVNGANGGTYIHRLVALAFIGAPPEGKPHVNHKDRNSSNNHWANLEWCSQSENNQHRWDTTDTRGKLKRYTPEQYKEARELRSQGLGYQAIANRLGMTYSGVEHAVKYSKVVV